VVLLYQLAFKVIAAAILYLEALHRLAVVPGGMGCLRTADLLLTHCPEVLAVVVGVVIAGRLERAAQLHRLVKATLAQTVCPTPLVVAVAAAQELLELMQDRQGLVA
jgi:hypothetical protein